MSIEEFIEEYRLKLDSDIQALSELTRLATAYIDTAPNDQESDAYRREAGRLKSKLEGVRLAKSQFNDLVRILQ